MHAFLVVATSLTTASGPSYPAGAAALVDASRIPPGVRQAWDSARGQEGLAAEWAPEWRHPEPREKVAASMARNLEALAAARHADPANLDLLLAAGLAGRWAHNLDVVGAFEAGTAALERAREVAPRDPRPRWFLGTSLCQTPDGVVPGMRHLLATEKTAPPERLSVLFWREYSDCSGRAFMPSHDLFALEQVVGAGEATEHERRRIAALRKELTRSGVAGEIPPQESWATLEAGERAAFRSMPCGFVLRVRGNEELSLPPARQGTCLAQVKKGPFAGMRGPVLPSVTVLARVAKPGETLAGVLAAAARGGARATDSTCPAVPCLRAEADRADLYREEGGGLLVVTAFERPPPALPGLALEEPLGNLPADSQQARYFRPVNPGRYPGTIFYMVLLDTARSVLPEARAAYEQQLRDLRVE